MQKPLSVIWQAIVMISLGVILYLVDCLIAHRAHPEVPWLESGVYNWGPFGVLASAICLLTGIYFLVKKN